MKLLSVATENFKKLGTFSTQFKAGLNLIAGDNARGKSSLLEAIKMALFGVAAVPGKKEAIPTWGQTKASVTLVFQTGELDVYTLVRTLTTAKLTKNNIDGTNELKANGHTPVTLFIEEHLGLTLKDWELFIQSSQGSAAGILTFGAAALNKKVEEFAGVDLIDKIQTLAQQRAGTIGARAEAKLVPEERMAELREESNASLDQLQVAQSARKEAEEALAACPQPPAPLEGPTAADMRKAQRAVDVASVDVDKAEASVKNAKERLEDARARVGGRKHQSVEQLKEELAQLESSGNELKVRSSKLRSDDSAHEKLEDQLTALRNKKDSAEAELAALETLSVADMRTELVAAEEYAASTKADISREQEAVGAKLNTYDSLQKMAAGSTCPTCKRAKEDHDPETLAAEAAAAKEQVETAQRYVAKLQDDLKVFEASAARLRKQIDQRTQTEQQAASAASAYAQAVSDILPFRAASEGLRAELETITAQLEKLRNDFAEKRAAIRTCESHNTQLDEDIKQVSRLESELEVCEDHLTDANKVLEDLPDGPQDAEIFAADQREAKYQQDKHDQQLTANTLNHAVSAAVSAHSQVVAAVKRTGEALDSAHATNKAAEDDVAEAKRCERLVRFLRERRQSYLKEVWDTIGALSSSLVRKSSSQVISRIDNREGEFFYEEEGNLAPTISASGAQKALIGTSLRMGLSRALYGGDSLMIFDEPTEGCTEFNASNMVATLATSARQVLLITHRENDQALAQHIINVG